MWGLGAVGAVSAWARCRRCGAYGGLGTFGAVDGGSSVPLVRWMWGMSGGAMDCVRGVGCVLVSLCQGGLPAGCPKTSLGYG